MPTVAEQLKSAGWTDEDIAGFDASKMKGIESVFTAAEQERQQAELAQRAAHQVFEEQISPALNTWGNNEANLTAERDYWKTLAEKAKDGGFIQEAPPFRAGEQQRGPGGQFVPNANVVPGSPNFQEFENKVGNALGTLSDLQWRYQKLYGTVMPDPPTALAAEAAAQRMSLPDYAAKKYDFAGKQTAIDAEARKKSEDAIRKEAMDERDKYWSERTGSNPNVRAAETSRYAEVKKAVADGKRADPLTMTREQRHAATASQIRQDISQTVQ